MKKWCGGGVATILHHPGSAHGSRDKLCRAPMATPARLAANRRNAILSTGPRTPEGKAVACQNARTHGLLSRQVLLPDEDAAHLAGIREHLHAELAPAGDLETLLADRMVACAWRLRRLHGVEAEVFERERRNHERAHEGRGAAVLEVSIGDARSRASPALARYETSIERGLYRALHELQRLQAARPGMAVAALAVDVDVTVAHLESDEDA